MATTVRINNQSIAEQQSQPGNWVAGAISTSGATATATKAAPGTGSQHVITMINARIAGGTAAPTAGEYTLNLIFGASGATAALSFAMGVTAAAGANGDLTLTALNIEAPNNTAVTVEFAALTTGAFQSVNFAGYTQNVAPTPPLG